MSDKKEETAKIVHVVEDGGHFGFSECGACRKHVTLAQQRNAGSVDHCPHCGIRFEGYEVPNFGGSDF